MINIENVVWNIEVINQNQINLVLQENITLIEKDISEIKIIELLNQRGPTGEQGIQGIQGPQGIQGEQGIQGPTGLFEASFESVSKNLKSWNVVSSTSNSLSYSDGVSTVVKTITKPNATTVILTLSGDTPAGIDLIKTITLNGSNLPTWVYS